MTRYYEITTKGDDFLNKFEEMFEPQPRDRHSIIHTTTWLWHVRNGMEDEENTTKIVRELGLQKAQEIIEWHLSKGHIQSRSNEEIIASGPDRPINPSRPWEIDDTEEWEKFISDESNVDQILGCIEQRGESSDREKMPEGPEFYQWQQNGHIETDDDA